MRAMVMLWAAMAAYGADEALVAKGVAGRNGRRAWVP